MAAQETGGGPPAGTGIVAPVVVAEYQATTNNNPQELLFTNPDPDVYVGLEIWVKQAAGADIKWRFSHLDIGAGPFADPFGSTFVAGFGNSKANLWSIWWCSELAFVNGLQTDAFSAGQFCPVDAFVSFGLLQASALGAGVFETIVRWRRG